MCHMNAGEVYHTDHTVSVRSVLFILPITGYSVVADRCVQ